MSRLFVSSVFVVAFVSLFGMVEPSSAERVSANSQVQSCPFGSVYADGCSHAPADGNFINTAFFTYAKQSGQGNYYSTPSTSSSHPPPWNVAGVDYPVGYSTSHRLKDPAVAPLPPGCTYLPNGSENGGAIVVCNNYAGIVLDNWDFSLHNCTVLDIKNYVTGKIVVRSNKFVNGSNCSHTNGYLVTVEGGAAANFVFKHNFVDGNAANYPTSLAALVLANNKGKVTVEYNAFLHSPARPLSAGYNGDLRIAYNYWEGFIYSDTDGHGEVMINDFGPLTQQSAVYSFNTVLQPNNVYPGGGTATFYLTNGQVGGEIVKGQVDHNTSIINLNNGQETVAAAAVETGGDTYDSVTFQENYMDPTGSYFCFVSNDNENFLTDPVFSGNINMLNGRTITDFMKCP